MQQKLNKNSTKKIHWGKTIVPSIAKGFFFDVYENAKRKYSYRDISEILLEKYQVKISPSTLYRWSKKRGWINEFNEALLNGFLEALKHFDVNLEHVDVDLKHVDVDLKHVDVDLKHVDVD
jgi:IS30 family transposase